MTDLYLVEPELSVAWSPFSDCRPISELRAGAWLIRERWEAIAQGETRLIFGPEHLRTFVEDGVPSVRAKQAVEGPALVGRSDFAPGGTRPEFDDKPMRFVNDGETVGWFVPRGKRWESDHADWP